jgi:alpha-amylase/alpha-mannosidase (GH57 family)
MSGARAVCIHGHFYQPPRENPWTGEVEVEESAHPYHDWNERITAECYAPNAAARILDDAGKVRRRLDNYAHISFDFGPTLLSWLERQRPEVYRAVLTADRRSRERFGGHGSAVGLAYNHMILPLANARDRRTQVAWGRADFEHRFGRHPEGMWLPEAAVDTPSLEALAEAGIRFTVLAPHQARRVRPLDGGPWTDAGAGLDTRPAYRCRLPSGRSIDLLFYDDGLARAVSFEHLLASGERFVERLLAGFGDGGAGLVHLATDGETFGHHHRYGEMALAWALDYLGRHVADQGVEITNYSRHLAEHPPTWQVEIAENTSWSCVHGVERWRSDCGCHTGGGPGWNQAWRRPLREALDWLRDQAAPRFEQAAAPLLTAPWAARDDYVTLLLDPSDEARWHFYARHARRPLSAEETERVRLLLELQRHLMLMYTSCGWFFHDLAGIETEQILRYAGRALELAGQLFGPAGDDLQRTFLDRLSRARSNDPAQGDGRRIFESAVRSARPERARAAQA